MIDAAILGLGVVFILSTPYWLPQRVVALRGWLFARINGADVITVPGELVDVSQFLDVYRHPAANGRSKGARLSDLFWYWLSPGAHMHQEHLEPGPRYDQAAQCTRQILSMPTSQAQHLIWESLRIALPSRTGLVRLRDLVMPVWAEFYYRVVFQRPASDAQRQLIVDNANDVITALKGCGLRHMARRLRLTAYLDTELPSVPHQLPELFSKQEQVFYLQGAFFNTAVVQSSEATAHVLMTLASMGDSTQLRAGTDDDLLTHIFDQTMHRFPLFGVAHRITTGDIPLPDGKTITSGSVLCFSYPDFHESGGDIPFGVAANRPCPAWRLAPVTVKALVREMLIQYQFATTAGHTRPMPNRGPCLMTPRGWTSRLRTPALVFLRLRDRWEDLSRSVTQLVLGTYMVWQARRLRLCERYFEEISAPRSGTKPGDDISSQGSSTCRPSY